MSCSGYLMSSILLTGFNHSCIHCANLFSTGSTLSFLQYFHFFYGPINCILLCVWWISSLLSLVFLHPFVPMSRFTHAKFLCMCVCSTVWGSPLSPQHLESIFCSPFEVIHHMTIPRPACLHTPSMLCFLPFHEHQPNCLQLYNGCLL
jgi:hypothetical protein